MSNQYFEYVPVDTRSQPEDERPTFSFRRLRAREADEVEKLFDASKAADDSATRYGKATQGIVIALAGWRNVSDGEGQPLPFDPAAIDDAMDRADILEVRDNLLHDMTESALDEKRAAWNRIFGVKPATA
jgi:hypothetical protein